MSLSFSQNKSNSTLSLVGMNLSMKLPLCSAYTSLPVMIMVMTMTRSYVCKVICYLYFVKGLLLLGTPYVSSEFGSSILPLSFFYAFDLNLKCWILWHD